MQLDFSYYNPTTIHFGKDSLAKLDSELPKFGDTVMLVYGRNAIKSNGLYDKVIASLNAAGKKVVELSGVMPNPTYSKMMEGVELVREHKVDLILAVGGGSVVDCAKGISVAAYCTDQDPFQKYWIEWQDVSNEVVPVASNSDYGRYWFRDEWWFGYYARREQNQSGSRIPTYRIS